MLKRLNCIFSAVVFMAFCGCSAIPEEDPGKDYSRALPPGANALELMTNSAEYPDFSQMFEDRDTTLAAIEKSLDYFSKPSSHKWFPIQAFTHGRVVRSLQALAEILSVVDSPSELNGYMHLYFDVYRSVGWDGSGSVLFTAYCQPIFDGSRTRTAEFSHPLYALPPDLVKTEDGTPLGRRDGERVVPYYTRKEIETNRHLEGRELVWVRNALDAYIIHVQGSARINLVDGDVMHLGYSGKTDRPYSSLGQALVDAGAVPKDEISLAAIRRHFKANPSELTAYLQRNDSFVFFLETGPGGPWGSLGAPVTPYRTIATDKSIFPRGALCAVSTSVADRSSDGRIKPREFVSFALDQDTGGAIRSAGRCDIFVGTGPEAEELAGHTKFEGFLYYLFVKDSSPFGGKIAPGSAGN